MSRLSLVLSDSIKSLAQKFREKIKRDRLTTGSRYCLPTRSGSGNDSVEILLLEQ